MSIYNIFGESVAFSNCFVTSGLKKVRFNKKVKVNTFEKYSTDLILWPAARMLKIARINKSMLDEEHELLHYIPHKGISWTTFVNAVGQAYGRAAFPRIFRFNGRLMCSTVVGERVKFRTVKQNDITALISSDSCVELEKCEKPKISLTILV